MSLKNENNGLGEKPPVSDAPGYEQGTLADHARGRQFSIDPEDRALVAADQNKLHRNLKARHMQMIAMYVEPRLLNLKCVYTNQCS
jgi:amino acid transporter